MTMSTIHYPDSSAYLAGAIKSKGGGLYTFELHNWWSPTGSFDPANPGATPESDAVFPAKLMALKIENQADSELDLRLTAQGADGSDLHCVEASVSNLRWPDSSGNHQGAWLWLNDQAHQVQVSVKTRTGWTDLGTFALDIVANRITLPANGTEPIAKSREGRRLFCSRDVNQPNMRKVALVNWSTIYSMQAEVEGGGQSATLAAACSPTVRNEGWILVPTGHSQVRITVRDAETGVEQSDSLFRVYDTDANTVVLEDVGTATAPEIYSAPYAVVAAAEQGNGVAVVNNTDQSVRVWRQGEGPSQATSRVLTLEPGSTRYFTFPDMLFKDASGAVVVTTSKPWTLHWDDGNDDPKVIVKQDNCGEED